jgi:hypothetical protein
VTAQTDLDSLLDELDREIARVRAKADRWEARAREFPDIKMSFLRPAKRMRLDAQEALRFKLCGDVYGMQVALDNLRGYNSDD